MSSHGRASSRTHSSEGAHTSAAVKASALAPTRSHAHPAVQLQRAVGNRTMQRIVDGGAIGAASVTRSAARPLTSTHAASSASPRAGATLHGVARDGTAGPGRTLPHLDQIQRSFGPEHDLSGVRAHVGGGASVAARRIGSDAFAFGSNVAFSTPPSLHMAAHEAAHAVQQSAGIGPARGVGAAGDAHERNADAIADRVVRAQPAGDLLPSGRSATAGAQSPTQPSVQRYGKISGQPYDLLSDDGKMAVRDHSREAWAEASNITRSNAVLDGLKSKAKIEKLSSASVTVTPPGKSTSITLHKFRMLDRTTSAELETTDDCGAATQEILGAGNAGYESFVAANKRGTTEEFTKPSKYDADDNAPGGVVSTTEALSGEIYVRIFEREFKKPLSRTDALKEWDKLNAADKNRLSKKYGINRYAVPKVGQSITIGSERDMPGASQTGYNFHFGFNLMSSGHDYITLEDYASSGVRYYFDMYGPESKGQSWAEDPTNTNALDAKSTTLVVQHPESLIGTVNSDKVFFEDDPGATTGKRTLSKNTKVKIIRKGQSWMKVDVQSGAHVGKSGWILNQFFTDT